MLDSEEDGADCPPETFDDEDTVVVHDPAIPLMHRVLVVVGDGPDALAAVEILLAAWCDRGLLGSGGRGARLFLDVPSGYLAFAQVSKHLALIRANGHTLVELCHRDRGERSFEPVVRGPWSAALFIGRGRALESAYHSFRAAHPALPAYPLPATGETAFHLFDQQRGLLPQQLEGKLRTPPGVDLFKSLPGVWRSAPSPVVVKDTYRRVHCPGDMSDNVMDFGCRWIKPKPGC